jgi:hypothetical protein
MQLGQIANETDLARRLSIPQPTVHRWLKLLEVSHLLVRLPAFALHRTKRPRLSDTAGLRAFRAEYGEASRAGLLLHTGSLLEWITPDVLAAPWWAVC